MDADFEIEEEGFEDGEGEQVIIGTAQPPGTLMTFTGCDTTIHIVSTKENDDRDPTVVLMNLLMTGVNPVYLDVENLQIMVE